ncbi:hypothetical protein PN836_016520 [Ningiella sp. W23]|uniref:hypothetical protein n=1 Tax=Ningiella sp. W23 TaxID=3023715 RepID=UPI00375786CD
MKKPLYLLLFVFLLLNACSEQKQSNKHEREQILKTVYPQWVWLSSLYFLTDDLDAQDYAQQLQDLSKGISSQPPLPNTAQDLTQKATTLITENLEALARLGSGAQQAATNYAASERLLKRFEMLAGHMAISMGQAVLSRPPLNDIASSGALEEHMQSLLKLIQKYPVLKDAAIEVYAADSQNKLIAYSMRLNKARAYIAFNHSFDIHQMPLPFGFMTSTKVTLWRSSDTDVESYVTSSPIQIAPFEYVIVLVGV